MLTRKQVFDIPLLLARRLLFAWGFNVIAPDQFTCTASAFEVIAVQCTRWSHVNLPLDILRAFFGRGVVRPFLRWRMLRHFFFWSPVTCEDYEGSEVDPAVKGIWIKEDPDEDPDLVVYYIHGELATGAVGPVAIRLR